MLNYPANPSLYPTLPYPTYPNLPNSTLYGPYPTLPINVPYLLHLTLHAPIVIWTTIAATLSYISTQQYVYLLCPVHVAHYLISRPYPTYPVPDLIQLDLHLLYATQL